MEDHDDCSFRLLPMVQSLAEKYRASVISNANSASAPPPNNDYPPVIIDGEVSAPSAAGAETSLSNTARRRSSRLNRLAPMSTPLNEDLMQMYESGGAVVQRIPNTSCPMHRSDPSSSSAAVVDGNVRSVLDVWSNQMHYNRMSETINLRQSNDNCNPGASVASCGKPISCPCPAESETSDGEPMDERRASSSSYCSRLCKVIRKIITKKIAIPALFLVVAIMIGVAIGVRVKYGKLKANPVDEKNGPEETHGLGSFLLSLGDFIVTTIEPYIRNDDNSSNQ